MVVREKAVEYTISASRNNSFDRVKIVTPESAYKVIREFYGDDILVYESVFILLLDRSNTTIAYAKISQGGVAGTVVDNKIICKYAIDSLASGVIIAHNHPSGNLDPSPADRQMGKRLRGALEQLDIKLLDNLIITDSGFNSIDY